MKSWSVISMLPLPQGQSEYKQQGSRVSESWLCSKNPESCQECTQVFLSEGMIQNCFSLIVHETKVFFFVCLFVCFLGGWVSDPGRMGTILREQGPAKSGGQLKEKAPS